jgi:pyruvate kinase|uniref:Pyruvate kinase n=1 Tax=Candidatus Caldatribacterium californiense TaxID=1454726 RepID=A0A7V4DEF2_9BACT
MRRTKIICTLGPSSVEYEILLDIVRAGMDVARINFSHGDPAFYHRAVELVRRASRELRKPVAILADLQGIKIRIGEVEQGAVELEKGSSVVVLPGEGVTTSQKLYIRYEPLLEDLKVGDDILLDDGLIKLEVQEKFADRLHATVLEGGVLRSRKGVHFPRTNTSARTFTEKDQRDLEMAVHLGVDYVALSFVRDGEDIARVRSWGKTRGLRLPPLIAKIERKEALHAAEEIAQEADGLMVARGDLGVEAPIEMVPVYQKMLVKLAKERGKIAIIATQMLESMRESSSPTRAEVTDIANAVLDGADALMLSAETAIGKYPVLATQMMHTVIEATETHLASRIPSFYRPRGMLPEAIVFGALQTACNVNARALVVFTHSGFTALVLSSFRPGMPILALTPEEGTARQLALVWGVLPEVLDVPEEAESITLLRRAEEMLLKRELARPGDPVVFVASSPFLGYRNLIRLHRLGEPFTDEGTPPGTPAPEPTG